MAAQNVEATIAAEIKTISPPAEYLESGLALVSQKNPPQGLLRWVGAQSVSKLIGERFGSLDADAIWAKFAELDAEQSTLVEIGHQLVAALPQNLPDNMKPQIRRLTTGARRLLNPKHPYRWGLMRAIANVLSVNAAQAAAAKTEEERRVTIGRCWAWCASTLVIRSRRNSFDSHFALF